MISALRFLKQRLLIDLAILALLATLSALPHVFRLGFYSDDWGFLSMLLNSPDQSLGGLVDAQSPNDNLRMRPTQMLYQAVLFKTFGTQPLGYHVANALVLASAVLFLYLVLREVGTSRTVASAVSAVYLFLPNYATDRFWFAAFGYTLTAELFLLSTFGLVRAFRGGRFVFWYPLALCAFSGSVLGMEVFLPLNIAVVLGLWLRARKLAQNGVRPQIGPLKTLLLFGGPIVIVVAAVWYKAQNAVGNASPDFSYLVRLAVGSVAVNFGTFGIALPHTVAWSLRQLPPAAMVLPCIVGAIVFWWLSSQDQDPPIPLRRPWALLIIAGGIVFSLGIDVFIVTPRVAFWSTGISNRVWIAASLGTAAVFVGIAGSLAALLPTVLHHRVFSGLIATICASCFAVGVALSAYWIAAWPSQLEILDTMQRTLPRPGPGTTLLLYGPCSYVGPAIVFESPWDFAGARQVLYGDPTLAGDVLDDTREGRFGITDEGLWTRLYGESRFYRFGPDLLLFDYRARQIRPLTDRASAVTALAEPTGCPEGLEGRGTVVLPLDDWYATMSMRVSRLWP